MSAENKYPEKKLTEGEYIAGVKSGDFLHVFDMNTNRVMVIQRDGYYPPEQLNKLVNLEEKVK